MELELRSYNDYADLTKKYLRNYNTFKLTEKMLEEDIRSKEQILSASLDVGQQWQGMAMLRKAATLS